MTEPDDDLDVVLHDWIDKLKVELGIEHAPVDIQAILGVAERHHGRHTRWVAPREMPTPAPEITEW